MINDLTVKQLIKICQKYKIKNYSGLRKKQLTRHVQKFLNKNQKKKHKYKMNDEEIIIYTWSTCPYCINAKRLLQENKMKYTEKEVVKNKKYLEEMKKKTGETSVPQIFINGKHIGGFSHLQTYLENR
jgi:glutaredoxin 3